jgi:N-methylhydantoinase B/oxoprolinase/acetone carboxylase alpha subunit
VVETPGGGGYGEQREPDPGAPRATHSRLP